jgi:tripartite-type tricarboxylate transporter receptor subunit TctC
MNTSRRRVLSTLALGSLLAAATLPATAQSFPSKPVRLIVPVGAGAAPDVVARLLAERLGAQWKQSLVVDNKPGAGGIPGMSALSHAAPDGYTLGFVPAAMATITPLLY